VYHESTRIRSFQTDSVNVFDRNKNWNHRPLIWILHGLTSVGTCDLRRLRVYNRRVNQSREVKANSRVIPCFQCTTTAIVNVDSRWPATLSRNYITYSITMGCSIVKPQQGSTVNNGVDSDVVSACWQWPKQELKWSSSCLNIARLTSVGTCDLQRTRVCNRRVNQSREVKANSRVIPCFQCATTAIDNVDSLWPATLYGN
jgi:hypothetical protein